MVDYYNIKKKTLPESNGAVVKVDKGKLEVFAGSEDLKGYGCTLNSKNNLKLNESYMFSKIGEKKAQEIYLMHQNHETAQQIFQK